MRGSAEEAPGDVRPLTVGMRRMLLIASGLVFTDERGSDEYKKLDGGLKDIAEKLDGIVIVVWKNKGYRIQ